MPLFNIEQVKLIHDHTKHITTLSAGSLVLLVTFYDKIGRQGSWKFLVGVALALFIVSILAATAAQIAIINYADPDQNHPQPVGGICMVLSWIAFCLAAISLCVFGIRNL
jgi:uncharacterized membrane protein YgdD (TMEM256/DUF423 family)